MQALNNQPIAALAEGPVYHDNVYWWVDISRDAFCRYDPVSMTHKQRVVAKQLGTVAPCSDGRWMLAHEDGLSLYDWSTGEVESISDVLAAQPDHRFNDGKPDPAGRFWVGSMPMKASAGPGSLYRWDPKVGLTKVLDGVGISNGLDWSQDLQRMYYIDTTTHRVDCFDYDHETGEISNRRPLVEIPAEQGGPDGMTLDAEGHAWVAFWGGSCLRRFHGETGELLHTLDVPASRVTSCCFAGEKLDDLIITTASVGITEEERAETPDAGRVFRVKPGVRGCKGRQITLS
ncbi:SMP-30/gluconolactonase/LRE family protein [Mucisphaera sp.]|uniref:SMP-30/gluconolactonase/LRE family protein n=1 Tax=Mucisphaera sp. TaxID=2913024 RepID=UPI003D0BFB6B